MIIEIQLINKKKKKMRMKLKLRMVIMTRLKRSVRWKREKKEIVVMNYHVLNGAQVRLRSARTSIPV